MALKVNEIAQVQIGYQSKGRIEHDVSGTHRIIQMKDFDHCHRMGIENLLLFSPERDPERYLVNLGNVLFLSRGQNNFACAVTQSLKSTVAASYFYILRLKREDILPEFLAWYINQAPAQEFLYNVAKRGSHMPIIPKAAFMDLQIPIPPLTTQETIVRMENLLGLEQVLRDELLFKRESLIHAFCLKKIVEQS